MVDNDTTARTITVPAQEIAVVAGAATAWSVPPNLWAGYVQEARKTLRSPATTTFSGNLYYRVHVTATGAAQSLIWPSDDALSSVDAASAPRLGILPLPPVATPPRLPTPRPSPLPGGWSRAPTAWAEAIGWCWANLAATDPSRAYLDAIFGHRTFLAADTPTAGSC